MVAFCLESVWHHWAWQERDKSWWEMAPLSAAATLTSHAGSAPASFYLPLFYDRLLPLFFFMIPFCNHKRGMITTQNATCTDLVTKLVLVHLDVKLCRSMTIASCDISTQLHATLFWYIWPCTAEKDVPLFLSELYHPINAYNAINTSMVIIGDTTDLI